MASAGAPPGPASRSAAARRQQTPCRGSPASLPGPTPDRTHRTRTRGSSRPAWPHVTVKNVEFSLKSSLQLHKCRQDSSQCDRCPEESQRSPTGPSCTTSEPYGWCAPRGRGFSQKPALLHHQQAGCSEPP
uniref:Uncharacterized protein n=1 Tax=Gasterosteus aculeatus TaxID=69293 RepID=G3PIM9_GASAC